jgi:hypothetical protein
MVGVSAESSLAMRCVLLLITCHYVLSSTHWVVTSEGRIKSVDFSVFNMQDPSDLVNFLLQEKRVEDERNLRREKEKLYKELTGMSREPDQDEDDLMKTDPDCLAASNLGSIYDTDLYMPIHIPLHLIPVKLREYLDFDSPPTFTPLAPVCSRTSLSDEKRQVLQMSELRGVRESDSYAERPEPGMRGALLANGLDNLDFVGHLIHNALNKNDSSWVLYHLATLFWRISGNSQQALKCIRNAVDTAPKAAVYVPLTDLAAVLHKNYFHKDAAFVSLIALDHAHEAHRGFIHVLIGNIHCVPAMGELDRCVEHYKRVLMSLDQSAGPGLGDASLHTGVKAKVHAVTCLKQYQKQLHKEQNVLDSFVQKQNEFQILSQMHQEKLKEVNSFRISEEEYYIREKNYQAHINQEYNKLLNYLEYPDSNTCTNVPEDGLCDCGGKQRTEAPSCPSASRGAGRCPAGQVEMVSSTTCPPAVAAPPPPGYCQKQLPPPQQQRQCSQTRYKGAAPTSNSKSRANKPGACPAAAGGHG